MASKKVVLHVAVVCRSGEECSRRPDGDWASFVGSNRDQVVRRAFKAIETYSNGKDYDVLVGELTSKAVAPIKFELVKL